MTEPRYTLEEAAILLRNQQCKFHGHDTEIILKRMSSDPDYIICSRCGETWRVVSAEPQPTQQVSYIDAPTVPNQRLSPPPVDMPTQVIPKIGGNRW